MAQTESKFRLEPQTFLPGKLQKDTIKSHVVRHANGMEWLSIEWPQHYTYKFNQHYRLTTTAGKDPMRLGWYRWSKQKTWGFALLALASFTDGFVEGYEFDGRVAFERKFGADPYGYWGSKSYEGVRDKKLKGDFYHQADDLRKISYIGGGLVLGIGGHKVNNKKWHYLLDFGLSMVWTSFWKSRGMNTVRYDGIF